ncbi:hypothetical protein DFJ58DRAFT_837774 [Suillus subalutaceus]|uniref:uncharacterized protein n=1 Tax=Suillus subalutaceus TaxID=48586 RepID=UPI001B863C4A|nr:uncharacterized protein DFJ58DRAFT_837774 [Suillus subalutaceus]KAG1868937.1 hypothetical protein DFJ58DRAFT_837774 [Suillus subalutaceus]
MPNQPSEPSQTKVAKAKRTWCHAKKQDPTEAEQLRLQQNEHKQISRARQKLAQQGLQQPSAKRCRAVTPDADTSHSAPGSLSGNTAGSPSDLIPDHAATLVNPSVPSRLFSHISVATEPSPITRDVEVMTELPYADPPHSENDPTVPSTSLIPLVDAKDLATNIIGVKVSAHLETVKWSSGFTTVLPCIWKDGTLREGKCIILRALEKPQAARLDLDYLED